MMPLQGSLSIERMCQLAGVSRAGFYRSLQERAPVEEEMETRSAVQSIAAEHRFEVYLNLASRMKLNGVNQLWVADITYIRLKKEFVYLAVVLDAFSRKVVGWALDRSLAARLPIAALEQAIAQRQPPPGLVHHSDRGGQYRCAGYMQLLRDHRLMASI